MARKTLKEKQIADTRYLYHFEKIVAPKLSNIPTDTHALVISDLRKTIFITAAILFSQGFAFFVLRNHLLRIPGISY